LVQREKGKNLHIGRKKKRGKEALRKKKKWEKGWSAWAIV